MPNYRVFTVTAGLLLCARPAVPQGLDFTGPDLPWAIVDQDYAPPPLLIKGGTRCAAGDASFSTLGQLPEGLTITGVGQFTGVPRKTGTYHFAVRVADSCGASVRQVRLVVAAAPILVVSADRLEFRHVRGGPSPEPQALLIRGTWPDLAYSIDSHDAAWLRATPTKGLVPRAGGAINADRVEVSVTPGSLSPGIYETKLIFRTRQGANAPEVKVQLTVE